MPAENIVCVKCTSVLDKSEIAEVEVDLCPRCGGLWLDRDEIDRLAGMADTELAGLRGALHMRKGPPPIPAEAVHQCPACPGTLAEVVLGPVKVELCGECEGVFLDRGELDQAVETVRGQGGSAKHVLVEAAKAATANAAG